MAELLGVWRWMMRVYPLWNLSIEGQLKQLRGVCSWAAAAAAAAAVKVVETPHHISSNKALGVAVPGGSYYHMWSRLQMQGRCLHPCRH
jgi:hypothetical protein